MADIMREYYDSQSKKNLEHLREWAVDFGVQMATEATKESDPEKQAQLFECYQYLIDQSEELDEEVQRKDSEGE